MAIQSPFPFFAFLLLLSLINSSSCFNPKLLNVSTNGEWAPAAVTFYGNPIGAGSDNGACGYGDAVEKPPFNKLAAAAGPALWYSGKGCGACYQIKCTTNSACSGNPVTLTITDKCLEGSCLKEPVHFDLSGTTFGAMAKPGQADQLRKAGHLDVDYKRVACNYPGQNIVFYVEPGANPYYFSTLIEYEDGDGDLSAVALQTGNSPAWIPMQESWGAVWRLKATGAALQAPYSIKLTSGSGKTLVAKKVIPAGWQAGSTYRSVVNFH